MSGVARRAAGAAVALAAALAVAAGSRLPYPAAAPEHATLRLSWRARGERVEACRKLSEEEIARLPVHMRRSEECEGRILPYHLEVALDGRVLVRDTVVPSGARRDRPLYVYDELAVAPGAHRLAVRFVREDAGAARGPDGDGAGPATPARLVLDTTVAVGRGEVLLVTYDADRRALTARAPAPRAGDAP